MRECPLLINCVYVSYINNDKVFSIIMPRAEAYGSSFVCQSVIMPRRSQEAYCSRAVCHSVRLLQVFLVAH